VEHVPAEPRWRDLACDFCVTVTATFRLVYVFLVLEIGTGCDPQKLDPTQ
jgi:hypothetical protein